MLHQSIFMRAGTPAFIFHVPLMILIKMAETPFVSAVFNFRQAKNTLGLPVGEDQGA